MRTQVKSGTYDRTPESIGGTPITPAENGTHFAVLAPDSLPPVETAPMETEPAETEPTETAPIETNPTETIPDETALPPKPISRSRIPTSLHPTMGRGRIHC